MTRAELINLLIEKYQYSSYLEIGVNTPAQPGWSHDSVHIRVKHGVDPAPEVKATFPFPSDEFFKNHIKQKYDIIFVDGLHIFEQVYRDIINSLKWLNDDGTIVVHDCNPTKEITQRRERASDIWHGDVWKAILKLRMEVPSIEIYTVDTDEGCGIIRFGKQALFQTDAPESERNTFDFFNTHRQTILNLISVAEFKQKFRHRNKTRLRLPNVTVVAVTGLGTAGAVKALEYSLDGIAFREAVLIAHHRPDDLDPRIAFRQCRDDELVSQDPKNTNDYSRFMAYGLYKYIHTDYVLIVHNDAYVLRPEKWDPEFLQYDYIGAPWPANVHFTNDGTNVRVGNGGFSLRSAKLLRALNELHLPFTDNGTGYFHEDGIICVYYRKQLEDYGIRYAPVPLAAKFGLETEVPESDPEPFGFHNTKKAIPRFFFLRRRLRRLLKLR